MPPGFQYADEFLSAAEEAALFAFVAHLPFRSFAMHGRTARRRIADFGYHYSFEGNRLTPADPLPAALVPLQARAADLAGVGPEELAETLVTEYQPGAGIGWLRDAPAFGIVVGISLAGACRMRLRPRSAYVIAGEARSEREHTIPAARELRYSITFRTLRPRSRTRSAC